MYERFFSSKKTAWVAIICSAILTIGEGLTGVIIGGMTGFEYFNLGVRLLLAVFLFIGYLRRNSLAMQGGCSGLLMCMLYSQADFLLNDLFEMSTDQFVVLGFWGSFYLAGELMLMILELILTINHYVLFILNKKNFLRVAANQVTTTIILLFLLFQAFVVTRITLVWRNMAYYGGFNFGLIAVYVLIGCAEWQLAIEDGGRKA